VVLEAGRVAEQGSAHELIQNEHGYLAGMVASLGPSEAAHLMAIAAGQQPTNTPQHSTKDSVSSGGDRMARS
jgi:hypothetical protein